MRVAAARIQGYRCAADLSIEFDGLTALVGSGGVGKSTILYALDWFFHGGELAERDLHHAAGAEAPVPEVLVAVTFSDLNAADREALGRYVEGDTTTLTRSWNADDGQKLSGNALVLPEFEEVRAASGAVDLRKRYRSLYDAKGEELALAEPAGNREQVEADMEAWERANPEKCEAQTADARHLGGFTGTPLLASRFDYVLVGATTRAPEALGSGRGTVLDRLLSVIEELDADSREQIETLQQKAQGDIQSLVAKSRGRELVSIGAGLTRRFAGYFPGAAIKLKDEVAPLKPPQISVRALVSDRGGRPIEPELQGHGLQRALVMALLHELAETAPAAATPAGAPRALMLAIEEPELYQHPLQARSLARSLEELASPGSARPMQVAYSTHSPYFTRPALFSDFRLCRRDASGATTCVGADPEAIQAAISTAGYGKEVATRVEAALAINLREAMFARAVLLCEGPTDAAVLEGVGDLQGGLDGDGVAIAECGSKSAIAIAIAILDQLTIPFFALFDADTAARNSGEAEKNRLILSLCGEEPADWPERTIRATSANFEDTLESDLSVLWPNLEQARQDVAAELGIKGDKKPRVYRAAVLRVGAAPDFLLEILDAARRLAQH